MATKIIGREEELASVEAFLAAVEHGPAALILSGEAGIGKTSLWELGVAEAVRSFDHTLTCRCVEVEASLSFAGLSELISPALEEVAASLASPRRRALEVALLLAEPGDDAPDAHAIGLAVLDVLRALSEHGPVLVAVDDVQWLDSASAGVLQIAFRRLREAPVGLLATLRVRHEAVTTFQLDHAFPGEELRLLSLGALSAGALHRLLKERLGLELTRPELSRVQEATAGNPFFALELGRELVRTNTRPTPGRALRVPDSLRELLGGRLARLPADTVDVLLLVAALARPSVELVATAHGNRDRVVRGLEAAAQEGVVTLDESRVRFLHPLLASICYEEAPPWKRRAIHQTLAGAVSDLEERARHLALAAEGPDAAIAFQLDLAAVQAAARGAPAAAADLSELAAQLTLDDDAALRRQRRLRAATFHRLAGDSERAGAMLEQLLTEVPHGVERADVLFELASTLRADPQTTIALLNEALADASDDNVRLARILGYRGWIRLFQADIRAALADARAALEKAELVADPTLIAAAIGHVATAEGRAGEFTPDLLERGVEIEERLGLVLAYSESPSVSLSRRLVGFGELDRARAILESVGAKAAARGDEALRGRIAWSLGRLEWFAGNWHLALEHLEVGHELMEQTVTRHDYALAARLRALVEADLGLVDEARASAKEALATSKALSDREWTTLTLGVLGRLELALGDLDAALGYLRELPGELLSMGYNDPSAPLWADAIEALLGGGELERASVYLERHEASARRLGSPWAIGGAARCRGLVLAAEGDFPAAFEAFARSLTELEGLPFPFERGRTLLCLGSARRRAQQKRSAREALEQALAVFDELGARLWADKARAELRRISGRRAPSDELTEAESRVASLAAKGRSNREIAAELYMGLSTVEAHLSHIYRKLGIRSRTELSGWIATRAEAAKPRDEAGQS